jgi:hypothetical protein
MVLPKGHGVVAVDALVLPHGRTGVTNLTYRDGE